jgi:CheY-like chemotaxis protein
MPRHTILVVDDSPTILKLVQLVLTKAGHDVTTADDGAAGLVCARTERPSLILLDYLLPERDGLDICADLAADESLRALPVVLMSARGEELDAKARHLPNVVDAISKPFSPDALLAVVTHVLEKHAGKEREPDPSIPLEITVDVADSAPVELPVFPSHAALAGRLGAVSIADVYGLLALEGQSGQLALSRDHTRLRVTLRDGRVLFASAEGVAEEFLLGRFLVESGELTPAELAAAIEDRRSVPPVTGPSGLLGKYLVDRGLVTPPGLRKAVNLQTAALVFETLRWGSGHFWFDADASAPTEAEEGAPGLAVDALLMEGFRRVDEWRVIERTVGDFDLVFVRNEERVAAVGRGTLSREEQAVLELVNGRHDVREIIAFSRMGSFDATKMLFRLLQARLIRRRTSPVAT